MADSLLGRTLDLTVGAPAHGGSCVARYPSDDERGRVVFVRHALPGETVRAVVTKDGGGAFCFADAVEIVTASPDRVTPPCPHAHPGGCGGCDWQHASGPAQRRLKAAVVRDQFAKLARLDVAAEVGFTEVEELPGGLLGWRTRNLYAVGGAGSANTVIGLRKHSSHEIVPVGHCPLGVAGVADVPDVTDVTDATDVTHVVRAGGAGAAGDSAGAAGAAGGAGAAGNSAGVARSAMALRATGVEFAKSATGEVTTLTHRPGRGRQARGRRPPDRVEITAGPRRLRHDALGRSFTTAAGGFWQVHPAAVDTFAAALLDAIAPRPGERVLDLYAGAGALTAALASAVGEGGAVIGVESSRQAVADAAANLADLPQAQVRQGRVTADELTGLAVGPDVIVLDPPRAGAGRAVMSALCALSPRVIGYVACDPAALARDVAVAIEHGWRLESLRAFDAFPMTHHVECVATIVGSGT